MGIFGLQTPVQADYSTTVNSTNTFGTWEGWGVSLCWWANVFGNRTDIANLLFTTNRVTLSGQSQSLPGLGLNIARYNVGACTTNSINVDTIQLSANIPAFKQIQGYWLNWFSADPGSASWNWNADANQRAMLQLAKARGANILELFSNSPVWWMCYNHNPSGADSGSNDNLQSWNHNQHAAYLATVAKYAHDNWGILFTSVEPFNEPIASWWTSSGTQEGCHFNNGTQAAVIGYLRSELDNRGLTSTIVSASDESFYDQATSTWNSFNSTTRSQIGRVNVHGYQYGGGRRDLLYNAAAGKKLYNSEYGEGDGSGLSLARNLNLDFRWLHMTAWCYWQPLDSGGWGLLQSNPGDNWIGPANPKYFVLAHYTRHIRPGMTILDGGEGNTIAAYDAFRHRLVLVTMNYDTAQSITYDLSRFYNVSGPVQHWTSTTDGTTRYVYVSTLAVTNKSLSAFFTTNTIQTFEIQNVYIAAPPPQLALSVAGDQLVISWPGSAVDFWLYSATNLASNTIWQSVGQSVQTNGANLQVTLPRLQTGAQFFRLSNK
jgi:galactan endo-1,6-beta-galactosidase